jgi:hypothetical protein
MRLEHFFGKVHTAVSGGFRPYQRAPSSEFVCKNTGKPVAKAFVLPEQETDFTSSDADIAAGTSVSDWMTAKLGHKALAKRITSLSPCP